MILVPPPLPVVNHIHHAGWTETQITVPGGENANRLTDVLSRLPPDAQVITADLFGSRSEIGEMEKVALHAGIGAPLTRVLSMAPGFGGMQLVAVSGGKVTPVVIDGTTAGYLVEGPDARQLYLGNMLPADIALSREAQTESVFSRIENALSTVGMTFQSVTRTWFYNDRILDWYGPFNSVRTSFFERHRIHRMPASTGIGVPNPAGAALVAKVQAMVPRRVESAGATVVRSPLQCDAFAYGSAFSRAMMVRDTRSQTLHISGTAAIEPDGTSAHPEDPAEQIRLTMDVVWAILDESEMDFADTTRAVAYFRNPDDIALWEDYLRRQKLESMPVIALVGDICRDNLLFELELELQRALRFREPATCSTSGAVEPSSDCRTSGERRLRFQ